MSLWDTINIFNTVFKMTNSGIIITTKEHYVHIIIYIQLWYQMAEKLCIIITIGWTYWWLITIKYKKRKYHYNSIGWHSYLWKYGWYLYIYSQLNYILLHLVYLTIVHLTILKNKTAITFWPHPPSSNYD